MQRNSDRIQAKTLQILDIIIFIAATLSIFALIIPASINANKDIRQAFDLVDWSLAGIFIVSYYIKWGIQKFAFSYLKSNLQDFILIFLFFVLPLPFMRYTTSPSFSYFIDETFMAKLYLISNILLNAARIWQKITKTYLQPALLAAISFLLLILAGTGFLLLPGATTSPERIRTIDAFFTATSATCLTGLTVVDTGSYFSQFGQVIILSLIQIGGIGLVTIVTFFSLLLGKGLGLRETFLISDTFGTRAKSRIPSVVALTILLVFIFESAGALLLYFTWAKPYGLARGSAIYYSIFHSISSFCNSRFTLFNDNYMGFRGDITFNIIISCLIFLGGIGFVVMINLIRAKILRRGPLLLHTKLVLTITFSLIVIGFACLLFTEWRNSLYELSIPEKFMSAFFLSLNSRTAGFATINISELTFASQFLLMFLMFIGASPGGTGGGIKTSTFGVFICHIWSLLRGENSTHAFKRSINIDDVNNALLLIVISAIIISLLGFLLLFTEEGESLDILFDLFSAFGNVGFTVDMTGSLTDIGKIIIIIAMFIGRVGPLTIVLAISQFRRPRGKVDYEYPEGNIIVG